MHLAFGAIQALFYLRKGLHNQAAEKRFTKWNKGICDIFSVKLSTKGKMETGPTLFVMNHISWLDISVLASQQPLHFLSKSEVRYWPIIGWLAYKAGTLFIQRGRHGAAEQSLSEITDCLQSGHSVVIFPEGTTTDGSYVKKFHGRLLQAAIDADVIIQPVALSYPLNGKPNPYVPYIDDMNIMDSLRGMIQTKVTQVELKFLQPISEHIESNDVNNKQLAVMSHDAIQTALGYSNSN